MSKKFLSIITSFMRKKRPRKKETFFEKLVKEDTNVSMMNFFLMSTLAVGVILLFVPVVGMSVDIWFNHTITINLSDMALYVGAVAGIFAAGGLSSSWTEFAYSKYNVPKITEEDMARREEAQMDIEDMCNNDEFESEQYISQIGHISQN